MRSNLRKNVGVSKTTLRHPRVQFPPAGGTVCEADRSRTNKKDTLKRVFFIVFSLHYR